MALAFVRSWEGEVEVLRGEGCKGKGPAAGCTPPDRGLLLGAERLARHKAFLHPPLQAPEVKIENVLQCVANIKKEKKKKNEDGKEGKKEKKGGKKAIGTSAFRSHGDTKHRARRQPPRTFPRWRGASARDRGRAPRPPGTPGQPVGHRRRPLVRRWQFHPAGIIPALP